MGLFTDGFKLLKKASEPLYKTPKSIQETIEIMAVAENGLVAVIVAAVAGIAVYKAMH